MTPEQEKEITSRGETFGELARRARADWEPPIAEDSRSPRWVKNHAPEDIPEGPVNPVGEV